MTTTMTVNAGVALQIKRPTGAVERVELTRFSTLTPQLFARIQAETTKAGRGDVLSWEQLTAEVVAPAPSAADLAEQRCIDQRRAIERAGAGGEARS